MVANRAPTLGLDRSKVAGMPSSGVVEEVVHKVEVEHLRKRGQCSFRHAATRSMKKRSEYLVSFHYKTTNDVFLPRSVFFL